LNKMSGQTMQTKTQNPLYYGTEGVTKNRVPDFQEKNRVPPSCTSCVCCSLHIRCMHHACQLLHPSQNIATYLDRLLYSGRREYFLASSLRVLHPTYLLHAACMSTTSLPHISYMQYSIIPYLSSLHTNLAFLNTL
jgi:hypothetical protein